LVPGAEDAEEFAAVAEDEEEFLCGGNLVLIKILKIVVWGPLALLAVGMRGWD
jgi:hypothetical protein